MNDRFIALILARGGSKSVPRKNIKSFCNTNCLSLTIRSLLTVLNEKQIAVSSDSKEILQCAEDHNVIKINRPKELANDFASSEKAWLHGVKVLEENGMVFDNIIAPQVTSPLRYRETFPKALDKFISSKSDCLFSATLMENLSYQWEIESNKEFLKPINFDPYKQRLRRQDINNKLVIKENGSFYIFKKEEFIKSKNRYFGKIGYVILDKLESLEIDDFNDWEIVKSTFKNNKKLFYY